MRIKYRLKCIFEGIRRRLRRVIDNLRYNKKNSLLLLDLATKVVWKNIESAEYTIVKKSVVEGYNVIFAKKIICDMETNYVFLIVPSIHNRQLWSKNENGVFIKAKESNLREKIFLLGEESGSLPVYVKAYFSKKSENKKSETLVSSKMGCLYLRYAFGSPVVRTINGEYVI